MRYMFKRFIARAFGYCSRCRGTGIVTVNGYFTRYRSTCRVCR
jgi:hypothetical protein